MLRRRAAAARGRTSGSQLGAIALGEAGLRGGRGQAGVRARSPSLRVFRDLIVGLADVARQDTVSITIGKMLDQTGYLKDLRDENTEEANERIENLMELVSAAREYESRDPEASLGGFVDRLVAALRGGRGVGHARSQGLADDDARGEGAGVPAGHHRRDWRKGCSRTRDRARTKTSSRKSAVSATSA